MNDTLRMIGYRMDCTQTPLNMLSLEGEIKAKKCNADLLLNNGT